MRSEREFLVDVLTRLNSAGVEYMLTGSMASNFWGTPRTTHDLDFVLLLAPSQVLEITAAFQSGFFIQEQSVHSAFAPPYQFNVLDEQYLAIWAKSLGVEEQWNALQSGKLKPKST